MATDFSKNISKLPSLIRSVRKNLGLSQTEVAQVIGIDQSAYSRIEKGSQKLLIEQWFLFCELTQISPDCVMLGYVDYLRPLGTLETYLNKKMLPQKYLTHGGTSLRKVLPLVDYFHKKVGEKKWNDYLNSHGLSSDFFNFIDHEMNLNFEVDLTKELIQHHGLNRQSLDQALDLVWMPKFHGQLGYQYLSITDPLERVRSLVSNQRFYETAFQFETLHISAKKLEVALARDSSFEQFDYRSDSILGDFLCQYRKKYLLKFAEPNHDQPKIKLKELQCQFKGSAECIYQMTL